MSIMTDFCTSLVCVCAIQARCVDGHGSWDERVLSKCVCDKCSLDSVTHFVFEGL